MVNSLNKGQFRGLHGRQRKSALQLHRLMMFEESWNGFLEGKIPGTVVAYRARLMLQCGLPRFR